MSRARTLTIFALLWAAGAPAGAAEDCPPIEPGVALEEGAPALDESGAPHVLVVLPKDASGGIGAEALELAPGARILESRFSALLCSTIAVVAGPPGADPAALIARLPESAAVVNDDLYETQAEPAKAPATTAASAPKPDPYRPVQWGHDALGIDAAHARTRGAGVRVAMLDSPADTRHPELRGVEAVPTRLPADPATHGTLIAGIVGAATGNGFGIAGLAPEAEVLSIPVCTPRAGAGAPDACRLYAVLSGLDVSWERGAQIVNLSLVGPDNRALARAIRRLDTLGVAVVAAAGNRAQGTAAYPAAYPWAIGVGATDRNRAAAESGPVVDLSAPGVEIVSAVPGDGFSFASGSSLAAAHATGVLALLGSASGGDVSAARGALFRAAQRSRGATARVPALAPVCDALALLGQPCAAARP